MLRMKCFTASQKMPILCFEILCIGILNGATGPDEAKYKMTPNAITNHFKSNQICFYSNLGKLFWLPELQAKLFFKRISVGGS